MDERTIIIADRDADYRSYLANHFRLAGYRVETADSVAHLVDCLLGKRPTVLLLEGEFDENLAPSDLVHLLKRCNQHLQVIMVSDQMSLASTRKVRQEGLFYHALRPAAIGDTEELGLAVASAFGKAWPSAVRLQAASSTEQATVPFHDVHHRAPVGRPLLAASWLIGLITLFSGAGYLAATYINEVSNMTMWIFLGFCALIVATQLLPIFRIQLPASIRAKHQAKQERASGKQG